MGKKKASLKKNTPTDTKTNNSSNQSSQSGSGAYSVFSIPVLIITALLVTEWIPDSGAGDPMFPQWIYMGVLSLFSTLYLLFVKDQRTKEALAWFTRSSFNVAYLALVLLAALSISWAWNKAESLSTLTYYVVTLITYFNLGVMLYARKDLFNTTAYLICMALFFQSFYATSTFLKMIDTAALDRIVMSINLNTGNKNILAASMAIKLPFLFYLMSRGGKTQKMLVALLFTITAFVLILLSSRESLLNLIIQSVLFIAFMVLIHKKRGMLKQLPLQLALVLLPLLIAYLTSAEAIKEAKKYNSYEQLTSDLLSRLSSIELSREGSSFRVDQWGNALSYMAHHPLTGTGLGNWRIQALLKEQYSTNFISSKHVHNDFLQIGAETGVAGILLYISMFAILVFYAIRIMVKQEDENLRCIAYALGAAAIAYAVDATFSFPHERPVIQILFIISAAWLVSLHAWLLPSKKTFPVSASKLLFPVFIPLLAISLWSMNRQFNSATVQMVYLTDYVKEKPLAQWSPETDQFPEYPDLAMTTVPVDLIKSRYMIEAKNYPEADRLINRAIKANPNTPILHFFHSLRFVRSGNTDSAIHYALKSIEYRPRIPNNYQMLYQGWMMTNDTAVINQSYRKARSIRYDELLEALYLKRTRALPEMTPLLQQINTAAGRSFPRSLTVILEVATYEFERQNYEGAFTYCQSLTRKYPKDVNVWQNMGLIRLQQAKFEEAIRYLDKAIEYRKTANGFPELLKARCLINLGRKPDACAWLQRASSFGNAEAKAMIPAYCMQ